MTDPRDVFVSRVVSGRSFVDVGGLWNTVAEKVSVAHAAGATRVAMFDVTPADSELWPRFRRRLDELGVPACDCEVGDVASYRGQGHDVVHCAGVLYHHPNPLEILAGLRRMTRGHLVLTSCITRTRIANAAGELTVPEAGVLFIPALTPAERRVLAAYWSEFGVQAEGVTHPCTYRLSRLDAAEMGPWWFLPTAQALRSMVRVCGFEIVDEASWWNDNACTILCRPVDGGLGVA
jgi:hypothetical protein